MSKRGSATIYASGLLTKVKTTDNGNITGTLVFKRGESTVKIRIIEYVSEGNETPEWANALGYIVNVKGYALKPYATSQENKVYGGIELLASDVTPIYKPDNIDLDDKNISIGGHLSTILLGNLGDAPEMSSKKNVANFWIAVNRSGSDETPADWYRIAAWDKLAEIVTKHLKGGETVMIDSDYITASGYADTEGKPAASLTISANNVLFLSGKKEPATQPA